MTTIIVDQQLRERLKDMSREVEFRDEAGHTVGRFLPESLYVKMVYEMAHHMFSEEELERARQQKGGKPLGEILSRLSNS